MQIGLFASFGIMLVLLYNTAIYIVTSISLHEIAKRNGVGHPWLAFVPIIQYYIVGSICEEYVIFGINIKRLDIVLCLIFLINLFVGVLTSFVFLPLKLITKILIALIFHKFYSLFVPNRALLFAVLSLLGNFSVAIILFLIKDAPMQMSAGAYTYPFADKIR